MICWCIDAQKGHWCIAEICPNRRFSDGSINSYISTCCCSSATTICSQRDGYVIGTAPLVLISYSKRLVEKTLEAPLKYFLIAPMYSPWHLYANFPTMTKIIPNCICRASSTQSNSSKCTCSLSPGLIFTPIEIFTPCTLLTANSPRSHQTMQTLLQYCRRTFPSKLWTRIPCKQIFVT